MSKQPIPQTDSIQELAEFWDTHDVTDYEDELEEILEPVFVRPPQKTIRIPLPVQDFEILRRLAIENGTTDVGLAQEWVLEKLKAA